MIRQLLKAKPYTRYCQFGSQYTARSYSNLVRLGDEVKKALANNLPVVSLESTIISHGMPYPQNVETALQVEDIIKTGGAVPATVGLINGEIVVGLSREEIELMGKEGAKVKKASRRDLSNILSQKILGATTVSTTMIASHLANIPVFVTGGIGGVHRGAETTFDISADLTELGRTPVGVVCSGVKSILDIPKTLEYLETQGVPVVTVSNTDHFPGFFVSDSGFKSPMNLPDTLDCAKLLDTQFKYQLNNGVVFAVPIPDSHAANGHLIQTAIQQALEECERNGVKGKQVTPFLLEKINSITQGKSLESNISLVKNNAKVGTEIAVKLSELRSSGFHPQSNLNINDSGNSRNRPMVVGGICLDLISKSYTENKDKLLETSTPGKIDLTPGGVGFNITQVLHQLKTKPSFHSAVGDDLFGNYLLSQLNSKNIDFKNIRKLKIEDNNASTLTAVYSGLYSKSGNMLGAVADMDVFNKIDTSSILTYIETQKPKIICLDGNLSENALSQIIAKGREEGSFIAFEPTSVHKSTKIPEFPSVHLVTPNTLELVEMYGHYVAKDPKFSLNAKELNDVSVIEELAIHLLDHFPYLLVKMGSQGVMLVTRKFSAYLKPEAQVENPVNVSGAGDTLVGTIVAELSKLDNAFEADENWWRFALNKGQFNARLTLNSKLTVSELIQ